MNSLLIFDLDGTLVDSRMDIRNSLNYALNLEGFPSLPGEVIDNFVGRGMIQLIQDALGNPPPRDLKRVVKTFWEYYLEHLLDETVLYSGVIDFLEKFSHHLKAVVTNKPYLLSKKILEGLQIDHHFKWLIGGDTLKVQKPSPEVLNPIFKDFETRPETIIIGDSEIDIECGKAAGITTCAISYGFRSKSDLEKAKPDFLVDRFEELINLNFFK